MFKVQINNEVKELTEQEYINIFGEIPKEPQEKPPTLKDRVAAIENAMVDLALNQMGVE